LITKLKTISELVVLPHSVFALPFALVALLAATGGKPPLSVLFWVVVCMVLARTAAMAYNRLVDADLDARNPRTKDRPIPSGRMTKTQVRILVWVCGILFILAASRLNPLAFKLSPVALAVVLAYSHMKRFTWGTHLFLGFALGIAPVGAWIAATGRFEWTPVWLTAAVICFVGGFDILYATQDEAIDRKEGLQSWVVQWGIPRSLLASRLLHALMIGFLGGFGAQFDWGSFYYAGLALLAGVLYYLHHTQYGFNYVNGVPTFYLQPAMMRLNGYVALLYLFVAGSQIWLF
jgi:4-hydroxybenzoate polyprenyltransferase